MPHHLSHIQSLWHYGDSSWLTEQVESKVWFTDGSTQYIDANQKWTVAPSQPHSKVTLLKKKIVKGNLSSEQSYKQCSWSFICIKGEITYSMDICGPLSSDKWLSWLLRGLEKAKWNLGNNRV